MMFRAFNRAIWLLILVGVLAFAARMAWMGAPLPGALMPASALFAAWVYTSPRTHASRYLLPGLASFAVFILMPLLYTVYIAFTNFSGSHLLSQNRVQAWFAQDLHAPDDSRYSFRLHPTADPERWQVVLPLENADFGRNLLVSRPFTEAEAAAGTPILLGLNTIPPVAPPLSLRELVAARPWLTQARFSLPGGGIPLRTISLRDMAPRAPLWKADGSKLVNTHTGQILVPDPALGNYVDETTRQPVGPGWRVWTGTANFRSLFTDPALRRPFLHIFAWNIAFALLSVLITFTVGTLLACLLQWKALRFRALYRTLLILPYAIPAFIPILVFKGLFNENFGEINLLLSQLFGIAPKWFTDPWLARAMILIVNTWLGYPYMMIIASGMLQAVPNDLYEASAIDGAGPLTNLFRVTLPQIFPPLFPLLIASFAFNFNNFSLIFLLTGGKPDITGSATIAGTTDLLVSYTFRMAFKDSSARFGFASAVATLLFLVVALLAWQQLRWSERAAAKPSATPR